MQGCAFWGLHNGQPHLGGQITQKLTKMGQCQPISSVR